MTKQELIERVTRSSGGDLTKKKVGEIVDAVFDELGSYFKEQKEARFTYPGFGTFSKRGRDERPAFHPRTREPIKIPASVTVAFAPAQELKKRLNGHNK
jgi:DNA-binding protein HU-beta